MAPLRSSRTTRNQEHNPTLRNRAGLPDFDVTDGLPVRRWEQTTVKVNQDASADASESNNQSTDKDNDFPWPEQPLPSFWSQLSAHNQELVRRARMGNVNAKVSVWDPKTETYIPGIELERRETARKAQLNKHKSMNATTEPEDEDADKHDDEAEDLLEVDGLPEKRRKTTSSSNERTIEVRKWVQVPFAVAEKMPEPKYLADRRPGMESLYKGAYKATNGFGTLGDMVAATMSGVATGYDLGDGSGLGNAAGVLAPGSVSGSMGGGLGGAQTDGAVTPVRKNIPPRRKKKGGPGRKPKYPRPETAATATTSENATGENINGNTIGEGDVNMKDTPAASGERIDNTDGVPAVQSEANIQDGDGEDSGSESEGEGSEEGEIAPVNAPVHEEMVAQAAPEPVVEPVVSEPERAPEEEEEEKEDAEVVAAGTSVPTIEQEAKKKEEEEKENEVDVLGALEAALDKEAGEDV